MKKSIALILITCSCSTTRPNQPSSIEAQQCEELAQSIANEFSGPREIVQNATTGASYVVIGAGYTIDVMVSLTTGIFVFGIVCGPVFAAGGRSCTVPAGKMEQLITWPGLGRNAKESTVKWRTQVANEKSAALRKLASCYEQKGGEENLIKAYTQVEQVLAADSFSNISESERDALKDDQERLRQKLQAEGSDFFKQKELALESFKMALEKDSQSAVQDLQQGIKDNRTWLQVDTGLTWVISNVKVNSWELAGFACSRIDDKYLWLLPSQNELDLAIEQGLLDSRDNAAFANEAKNFKNFWLSSNTSGSSESAEKGILCKR